VRATVGTRPPHPRTTVRLVSYPPPHPGYPPPHPGYGYGYGPAPYRPPTPSTALAYVAAGLFLIGGLLVLVAAIIGWNGTSDNPDLVAALVGIAFSEDLTGNVDFAISASMTVACTTLTFALVLFARLDFVRWILAFVGALTTVYYLYAIIWLLTNDAARVIALVIVSFAVWAGATVVVLLPHTGRAMRGYQRKLAGYGQSQYYPPAPPAGYGPY
jgi:hypothetical protein